MDGEYNAGRIVQAPQGHCQPVHRQTMFAKLIVSMEKGFCLVKGSSVRIITEMGLVS